MRIHFLGGADTVTGSQHIVEANGSRVLRDCGMFQGKRKLAREINGKLPFQAGSIDSMILSHAHIDHSGNIPSLVHAGYEGPIHATRATGELCEVMLMDSARIQEQDAEYLNQKTSRKGFPPVVPLYTTEDAQASLRLFRDLPYHEEREVAPGIVANSLEAGHILGSALTVFSLKENGSSGRVGFAVDLGRKNLPLIRDPEIMRGVDVLVLESTYGNRYHDDVENADQELEEVINATLERQGKVFIPSFALERAQEVLYHLSDLISSGRIPRVPVYVDSPMAADVTKVFRENPEFLDEEFRELKRRIGSVMFPNWVHYTSTVKQSKQVTSSKTPCIVIAASGMCEFGRILHHFKHGIDDPANSIVIVGYQAAHTLGRRLVERQKEVRIFGDTYPRRAEIHTLNAFSGHADRTDLIEYVNAVKPKRVFLVHGESDQRESLAEALKEAGHDQVFLPARGDTVEL